MRRRTRITFLVSGSLIWYFGEFEVSDTARIGRLFLVSDATHNRPSNELMGVPSDCFFESSSFVTGTVIRFLYETSLYFLCQTATIMAFLGLYLVILIASMDRTKP